MTGWPAMQPSLDDLSADVDANGRLDQGWFIRLATGEKVLSESLGVLQDDLFHDLLAEQRSLRSRAATATRTG